MSVRQSKLCCRVYLVSGKVVDYAGQRRFSSHGHSHVADWFAKLGHICKNDMGETLVNHECFSCRQLQNGKCERNLHRGTKIYSKAANQYFCYLNEK